MCQMSHFVPRLHGEEDVWEKCLRSEGAIESGDAGQERPEHHQDVNVPERRLLYRSETHFNTRSHCSNNTQRNSNRCLIQGFSLCSYFWFLDKVKAKIVKENATNSQVPASLGNIKKVIWILLGFRLLIRSVSTYVTETNVFFQEFCDHNNNKNVYVLK